MASQKSEGSDGNISDIIHDDAIVAVGGDADFAPEDAQPRDEGGGDGNAWVQTTLDFQELDRVQKEQGLVREEVMNHLMFHKALLGEEEHYERINKYIEIVTSLDRCVHLSCVNIYDKSLAITFELVIEEKLNPWDVDLVKFSKLYLKRAKTEGLDLITAGRIILMAWTILKLQSKNLLEKAERPFEEPQDLYMDDFEYGSEQDLDFTQSVIYGAESPIKEMVWRKGKRPVTLIELVDAFEEARRASEFQAAMAKKREELSKRMAVENQGHLERQVHKDLLEEDMRLIWDRISHFNGHPISFMDIWDGTKLDWIVTLRSLLFLANGRWIKVWQNKFPFGEIYIKNIYDPLSSGAILKPIGGVTQVQMPPTPGGLEPILQGGQSRLEVNN